MVELGLSLCCVRSILFGVFNTLDGFIMTWSIPLVGTWHTFQGISIFYCILEDRITSHSDDVNKKLADFENKFNGHFDDIKRLKDTTN